MDLEELSMILEGDPGHGGARIDLHTGEVWPQSAIEYVEEVGEIDEDDDHPDRWLWVHCGVAPGPSRHGRPLRPARLMTRWRAFSNERQRGRALRWLAMKGFSAT
jgi:hypothetical protein